ncbi:MAG: ethanolamine ammonia-lyase subunit EutC [Ilumatobacteraceae bacterium]
MTDGSAGEPGALVPDPGAPGRDESVELRALTPARVGLGRAGGSMPTGAHLAFRADHARARDAVNRAFDGAAIAAELRAVGHPAVAVSSAAQSRPDYVRRPDQGRRLSVASAAALEATVRARPDLAIVLCDGLSPGAIGRHGAVLARTLASSEQLRGWTIGPITVVTNGRVAIGDEIGAALGARLVVVLIGERPGLSVPESIGAYLTFRPTPGRSDADRNCISNIHDHGLPVDAAARQIATLAHRARLAGLTGVALKDDDPLALN